jgi:hypothetical protein
MHEVQQISRGEPLFLYHMTSKCMYGVFEAAGDGTKDIIPNAFKVRHVFDSSSLHTLCSYPLCLPSLLAHSAYPLCVPSLLAL